MFLRFCVLVLSVELLFSNINGEEISGNYTIFQGSGSPHLVHEIPFNPPRCRSSVPTVLCYDVIDKAGNQGVFDVEVLSVFDWGFTVKVTRKRMTSNGFMNLIWRAEEGTYSI
uniref:Uncharacterized LOC100178386 n=1 Tax=Ciona intestinalis TaxID=7719 RepID=F6XFH2_CIOIN|nr:uncharacterized protein LOC100178386 [Ciona intestinalis]|eukprot:XP_002127796.1 uncharacterized protein LOC100178386 [Ciona intestinalis]